MVLGMFESASYETAVVDLSPGDLLAIFTDGIPEAVNDKEEEFGEERLLDILLRGSGRQPEYLYRQVTGRVREWQGDLRQHDDITLIVASVG